MRLLAPRVQPGDMVLLSRPVPALISSRTLNNEAMSLPSGEGVRLMRLSLPRLKMPRRQDSVSWSGSPRR